MTDFGKTFRYKGWNVIPFTVLKGYGVGGYFIWRVASFRHCDPDVYFTRFACTWDSERVVLIIFVQHVFPLFLVSGPSVSSCSGRS